jgi:hypothetical protein
VYADSFNRHMRKLRDASEPLLLTDVDKAANFVEQRRDCQHRHSSHRKKIRDVDYLTYDDLKIELLAPFFRRTCLATHPLSGIPGCGLISDILVLESEEKYVRENDLVQNGLNNAEGGNGGWSGYRLSVEALAARTVSNLLRNAGMECVPSEEEINRRQEEEWLPLLGPVRLDLEPGERIENRDPDRCKWRNELGYVVIRGRGFATFSPCCKVPGCMVYSRVPRDGVCGRPNCPMVPIVIPIVPNTMCSICRKVIWKTRRRSTGGSGECNTCNPNNIVR